VCKKVATTPGSVLPFLEYIPKSRGKDGESPFIECTIPKSIPKAIIKFEGVNKLILKENGIFSIYSTP